MTKRLRSVIILTVNYIINLYSLLVAKRFETLYHSSSTLQNQKATKVLDHYRSVRRLLPLMSDGNYMGNHQSYARRANGEYAPNSYGGSKSFYATQGMGGK